MVEIGRTFLAKAAKAVVHSELEVWLVYRLSVCTKSVILCV